MKHSRLVENIASPVDIPLVDRRQLLQVSQVSIAGCYWRTRHRSRR